MNYEELYYQAMSGKADALKTLSEMAGRGDEESQYVLSCVYDNVDSPFRDVELGMHWLKTSAGYGYEPAKKKIRELPLDVKKQYDIEIGLPNDDAKTKNIASDSIFSYEGRIDRTTYFVWGLVFGFVFNVIHYIVKWFASAGDASFWGVADLIVSVIGIYFAAALWVKRLHDCGRSGWWALLVPITQIVILFMPGEKKDNEYGPKID